MLVALYYEILNIDPKNPDWENRDRFVLSKGHSCIALYAVMAERGYFPIAELATFDAIDSRLQGHPDMTKLPGLDMSTGSLGQGLSPGVGMALGAKLRGQAFTTYVMLGDGETQEGQVWEAAFISARYELDNLVVILDWNKLQQFGWQDEKGVRSPLDEPVRQWEAFGWHVSEVDGHDIAAFIDAVYAAKVVQGQPAIVIAHTVKGKGISFMENDFSWHARVPTDDELEQALAELEMG
jgi:transketolase